MREKKDYIPMEEMPLMDGDIQRNYGTDEIGEFTNVTLPIIEFLKRQKNFSRPRIYCARINN